MQRSVVLKEKDNNCDNNIAKYSKVGALVGATTFVLGYQAIMYAYFFPGSDWAQKFGAQEFFDFTWFLPAFVPETRYGHVGNSARAEMRDLAQVEAPTYCMENPNGDCFDNIKPMLCSRIFGDRKSRESNYLCFYDLGKLFHGDDLVMALERNEKIYGDAYYWERDKRIGSPLGFMALAVTGASVGATIGATIAVGQCSTKQLMRRLKKENPQAESKEVVSVQPSKTRPLFSRLTVGAGAVCAVASAATGWGPVIGLLWGSVIGKTTEVVSETCSRKKSSGPRR